MKNQHRTFGKSTTGTTLRLVPFATLITVLVFAACGKNGAASKPSTPVQVADLAAQKELLVKKATDALGTPYDYNSPANLAFSNRIKGISAYARGISNPAATSVSFLVQFSIDGIDGKISAKGIIPKNVSAGPESYTGIKVIQEKVHPEFAVQVACKDALCKSVDVVISYTDAKKLAVTPPPPAKSPAKSASDSSAASDDSSDTPAPPAAPPAAPPPPAQTAAPAAVADGKAMFIFSDVKPATANAVAGKPDVTAETVKANAGNKALLVANQKAASDSGAAASAGIENVFLAGNETSMYILLWGAPLNAADKDSGSKRATADGASSGDDASDGSTPSDTSGAVGGDSKTAGGDTPPADLSKDLNNSGSELPPTQSAAPVATQSAAPVPAQSAAPVATQSAAPVPAQSAAPVPAQSAAPVATQSAAPVTGN